jgi:uncharacterized DUF497 family protein
MRDDEFEWDARKAARNAREHGVSFETARLAFNDPDCIEEDDPDPDEQRFSRLCRLNERVFVVVYTERGNRVRIISARVAAKHEQRIYFDR